jgi:hypothetical protein
MDPQRRPAWSPFFNAECAVVAHSQPTLAHMQAPVTTVSYICPNCHAVVERDSVECGACHADFSAPAGWKPLKNGRELQIEPGAFMLACFFMGMCFLSYLASVAMFGTWDALSGKRTLGTSMLWIFFRFNLLELLPFLIVGISFTLFVLRKTRLPKGHWPTGIFGWATVLFVLFLFVMLSFGFIAVVIAPFLFVPSVFLYFVGTVLVIVRMRAASAN